MSSNCFVVYDEISKRCFVVDPGSQDSKREIDFISQNDLMLDYVILTHEHTDHTWGVNALIDKYNDVKVVCSQSCALELPKSSDSYFSYYFDDSNYHYEVERVDVTIKNDFDSINWNNMIINFILTPGHTIGSMCFFVDNYLFTGDTLMQYKSFINKRFGSKEIYEQSLNKLNIIIKDNEYIVYPGHGMCFK